MTERKPPQPPKGAGQAGRKLWKSIVADLDLDAFEELILTRAVRCIDRLEAIDAELEGAPQTVQNAKGDLTVHPLVVESRQQSLVFVRLMASLRLPVGLQDDEVLQRPQRRGAARGFYGVRGVVA